MWIFKNIIKLNTVNSKEQSNKNKQESTEKEEQRKVQEEGEGRLYN